MIEVWEKQGKPEAAIMFVVEDITYNICDQVSFNISSLFLCRKALLSGRIKIKLIERVVAEMSLGKIRRP